MRYGLIAVAESVTGLDPELEIVKYVEGEAAQSEVGEYDQLYIEAQENQATEKEIAARSPDEDTASGAEPVQTDADAPDAENPDAAPDAPLDTDDTSTDVGEAPPEKKDAKAPDAESKDKSTEDTKVETEDDAADEAPTETEKAVKESILNDHDVPVRVVEGYFDAMSTVAIKTFDVLKDVTLWMGLTATPYLWQKTKVAMKYLSASVFWMYAKAVSLTMKTGVLLSERYKRFMTSLRKRQKEIEKLRQVLVIQKAREAVYTNEPESDLPRPGCRDASTINWMTIGGKTGALHACQTLNAFSQTATDTLHRCVIKDLTDLENLAKYSQHGVQGNILTLMRTAPFGTGFLKKSIRGYNTDPELLDSFVYGQLLPCNFIFIANIPKDSLADLETVSAAYRKSGISLGISPQSAPPPEEIPYLTHEECVELLNELEKLCVSVSKQSMFYVETAKKLESLKLTYKHYYEYLLTIEERRTLHEVLVEYIYLKQAFASQNYVPAMMDVHDYVNDYITHTLRYIKASIKANS